MKKIATLCILLVCSCASKDFKKDNDKDKNEWIFAFKAEACSSCLGNMNVKINNDISSSLRMEVLTPVYMQMADSIGKKHTTIIDQKSNYLKKTDLSEGKAITNGCLLLFSSIELDNIAQKMYRQSRIEQ